MTSAHVQNLTKLTPTQRSVTEMACKGQSDRQISRALSISVCHVSKCLSAAKGKLRITGDGPRPLVHWWWTSGPGNSEIRMAAVSDALRDQVEASNQIIGHYRNLLKEGRLP